MEREGLGWRVNRWSCLDRARKAYRAGQREQVVLDGVSLSIERRELVAVTGPSGCGKTTLLSIIGALDRADAGMVTSGPIRQQLARLLRWSATACGA